MRVWGTRESGLVVRRAVGESTTCVVGVHAVTCRLRIHKLALHSMAD